MLVQVQGFEELQSKIVQLTNEVNKKREVLLLLRQVATPTLNAARAIAPVSRKKHVARGKVIHPGNLKKSLGLINARKAVNPTVYVGAKAKGNYDGWYAHFVHEGVNVYSKGYKRKRTSGANNHAAISRTKGNPFLTNAYKQTSTAATADAEQKMAAFIQRRIKKLS